MSSEASSKKIFGIDLGTTFSAIAYINEDGKSEIIANPETNEMTTPSVVYFEDGDNGVNVVVGKVAKESGKLEPDNVIEFVKREIGTDWEREFFGTTYNPSMISAFILKRLAQDAESVTGCKVEDVVITCPAYFGEEHRKATEQAGQIAGLNVIQILDEPAAAALCYAFNNQSDQGNADKTILVYDLGGGTFDSTVLSIKGGNDITVVCTDGDHRLGGGDWDQRIIDFLATKFQEETGAGADIKDDTIARYDLRIAAESAKQALSRKESTLIPISYEGERAKIQLTRDEFNSMTQDLLQQTYVLTDKVLEIAKSKGVNHIDEILLVGGSTLMPQVQEGVKERYADPMGIPVRIYEPSAAVAKGAAIFAFMKEVQINVLDYINKNSDSGTISSDAIHEASPEKLQEALEKVATQFALPTKQIDSIIKTKVKLVATKSYGVEVLVGRDSNNVQLSTIIVRQTTLPCKFSATYGLNCDDQREVKIAVYSHDQIPELEDSSKPDSPSNRKPMELQYCAPIGESMLDIPAGKREGDPVEVTFELGEDSMLHVTAREPDSGNEIFCVFQVDNAMSQEEVNEAKKQLSNNITIM